ncbi:hypothetical protein IAR50_003719 [Cryptococcus sp. DSM 104548]
MSPLPESGSSPSFSWLDIFEDLPSHSPHLSPPPRSLPSPTTLSPSRTPAGQGHIAENLSGRWEDACPSAGTFNRSTDADNHLSISPQSLLPAATVSTSITTPNLPFTSISFITPLSHHDSPCSPSSFIQTPHSCHPPAEPIAEDSNDNTFVDLESDGEENARAVPRARRPTPPTFELPQDWVTDTPTPVRFHATTYEAPSQPNFTLPARASRQPSFSPTPVSDTDDDEFEEVNVGLRWLTHMSNTGGLVSSMARLRESMEDPYLWAHIAGISTYINNPKRRVCCSPAESASTVQTPSTDCLAFQEGMDGFMEDWRETSMVHGVYTVNLLSSDPELLERSRNSVIEEMRQARDLGFQTLVIHLGSEGQEPKSASHRHQTLSRLITALQQIISSVHDVTLALENTCHPSPTSLTNLASISEILTHFPPSKLKLCLDLSHLHVNEIDLNEVEGRKEMWRLLDRVGWQRVVGAHVSDNHVDHGGKGDRHANIGCGHITLSSYRSILSQPFFKTIPLLLETPQYFKDFHVPSDPTRRIPRYVSQIVALENERSALERGFIECMLHLADDEWEGNGQACLWDAYNEMKKAVERKIYKIVTKQGGGVLRKFSQGRSKAMGQIRATGGLKRKKKNKAKR